MDDLAVNGLLAFAGLLMSYGASINAGKMSEMRSERVFCMLVGIAMYMVFLGHAIG